MKEKKRIIAAIHAGWKGAFKGIVNNVIKFMLKKGCDQKYISAAIGPSIKQKSYEVREDFKQNFQKNKKNKFFFTEIKMERFILIYLNYVKDFNLNLTKSQKLTQSILILFIKNNFFSARRSLKLNEND